MCTGEIPKMEKHVSKAILKAVENGGHPDFGQATVQLDCYLFQAMKHAVSSKQSQTLRTMLGKVCFTDYAASWYSSRKVSAESAKTELMELAITSYDLDAVLILLENGIRADGSQTISKILWNSTYYDEGRLKQIATYPTSHSFLFWNPFATIDLLKSTDEYIERYIRVGVFACREDYDDPGYQILWGLISLKSKLHDIAQLLDCFYKAWGSKAMSVDSKVSLVNLILEDIVDAEGIQGSQQNLVSVLKFIFKVPWISQQPRWSENLKWKLSAIAARIRPIEIEHPELKTDLIGFVLLCLNRFKVEEITSDMDDVSDELIQLINFVAADRTFRKSETPEGLWPSELTDYIGQTGLESLISDFGE